MNLTPREIKTLTRPIWDATLGHCIPTVVTVLSYRTREEAQQAARTISAAGFPVGYETETSINTILPVTR